MNNSLQQHIQSIVSIRSKGGGCKKLRYNLATVKLLRHVTVLPTQRVAFVL